MAKPRPAPVAPAVAPEPAAAVPVEVVTQPGPEVVTEPAPVVTEPAPAVTEPAPAVTGPVAAPLAFDLAKLKLNLGVTVTHKPGADLTLLKYPLLVYAPGQHGPGVRTEDKGIEVAAIVAKAAELPDYDQLAAHFGTTRDHVAQAIAYAVAATPGSGYTSNPTVTITGGGSGATATAASPAASPEPGA